QAAGSFDTAAGSFDTRASSDHSLEPLPTARKRPLLWTFSSLLDQDSGHGAQVPISSSARAGSAHGPRGAAAPGPEATPPERSRHGRAGLHVPVNGVQGGGR